MPDDTPTDVAAPFTMIGSDSAAACVGDSCAIGVVPTVEPDDATDG